MKDSSVTFNELLTGINSVGSVFAINSNFLMQNIDSICKEYPDKVVYKDDAGVQVLQIKESIDLFTVLNDYYGN